MQPVGVTSYINGLKGQWRPKYPGKANGSANGLRDGRKLDVDVGRFLVHGVKMKSFSRKMQVKLRELEVALQQPPFNNITTYHKQITSVFNNISSRTDIQGTTADGVKIFIEIKNTNYTLTQHDQLFRSACRTKPIMSNGLPNTQESHYLLQTCIHTLVHPGSLSYVFQFTHDGMRSYRMSLPIRAQPNIIYSRELMPKLVATTDVSMVTSLCLKKSKKIKHDENTKLIFINESGKWNCVIADRVRMKRMNKPPNKYTKCLILKAMKRLDITQSKPGLVYYPFKCKMHTTTRLARFYGDLQVHSK